MDFFKTIENGIRTIFGGNSNQNGQNSNDWEEAERRRKQAEEEQRKKEEEQRRREEEERRRQEAERKRQEEERQRQEAEKQRQIKAAKPREQREAEFVEARVKKEREEWDKSRDVFSKALGLNAFNENQARAAAKASFAANNTNWDDENQVKETQKLTRANKDIADSIASDKNQRANTEGLGRAYQDITRAEDSNQINKQKMREYLSNAYQAGEMTAEQVKAGIEKYGLDNFIDGSNHKHFDASTGKFRQATMGELAEDFTGKVQGAAEPINQLGEAVADASDTLLRKWWDKGDSTPDSFNFADPADYLRALTGLPGGMVRGVTGFGKKMTGGIGKTLAGGLDNDANKIIAGAAQIGDATIDIAGLNYGGTGTLIKSLGKETAEKIIKSGGKETVKEILKNAAQEGGEEAVQNVLEQISNNGGRLDKIDLNQVKESGIAGAVGGGLASGIGQANAKIKNSSPNFKNLGENIKDLYHDGKLAPQTALTPNAGSRARLEKAFEDGLMGEQMSGNKNLGKISNQDLMHANQIQEVLNRDNLNPNRNISINGETAAEHAQKRFAENPENTPRKLAETAHNAIFGNNHQILANNQDNANNVLFINKNTPQGVVPVGKSSISSENEIFSVIPTRERVLDKIEKDSTNLVKNSTPAEAGATYSLSQNNKNVNFNQKYQPEIQDLQNAYQKYGDDFEFNLTSEQQAAYEHLLRESPRDSEGRYIDPATGEVTIDKIVDYNGNKAVKITDKLPDYTDRSAVRKQILNKFKDVEFPLNEINQTAGINRNSAGKLSGPSYKSQPESHIETKVNSSMYIDELGLVMKNIREEIPNNKNNEANAPKYLKGETTIINDGRAYDADLVIRQYPDGSNKVYDVIIKKEITAPHAPMRENAPEPLVPRAGLENQQRVIDGDSYGSILPEIVQNVNKKGIIKNLKTDNIQSVGEIMESQPFKNVPLEGDNLLTKGNLYNMAKIGSSKDLTTKPIKDGSYEYREHKVVKNGKSYQQFERRYIGNGEIGDWQPYNKALYLWRSQSEKIDKANRDELIQEALSEARKTGDVKDFVGYTDPTTGAQVVKALTGEKTIDGGLVRNPKTGEVEGNHIAVTPFGVVNYVNGKYDVIDADALATTKKSKVGVSDTFERAVDKTYGENSDTANNLKDIVSEKRQNYSGFVEEFQKINHEHQQLAKEVGKAKPFGKSEKEFWQDTGRLIEQTLVGEHKSSDENFKAKYGEKAYLEAKKYADWSRENYDKMIDGVNTVRRLLGKEEIEYRKNYLPHISKDGNWLDGAKNGIATATGFRGEMEGQSRGEIPANIAGLSETFKPTQKWNGNEKQRTGAMQDYELDPRKVMEKYAEVMLYNKHMEQTMARARSVEQAIRAQTEAKGQIFTDPDSVMKQGGEINNQILHKISDWTNALAGKSSAFDRSFLDRTNKQMQVVQKLERINGANKIAGNISSTFAQALNLPETIAQNGINKTAQSLLFAGTKEAKTAREKSAFLRERYMDTDTKFSKSGGQKVSELVSKASGMDLVEKAFINLNWGANYWRLKSEGYQGHELIKMTDRATAKAVGGRGIGDMPEIYRSAVGKMFLQFTYETNETWKNNGERLKGVVKNLKTGDFKNAGKTSLKMAEAYVATMALNALYKQMTGNEPLPEPITPLVNEITKNFDNDDENNTDLAKLGAKAVEQVGKANPFAQAALNLIPKTERQKIFGKDSDLGRYDGASGVAQTATNLIGAGVNALQGNGEGIVKNLLGVVPGGSQIKKTVGGAEAMLNGEVKDNKGNTKYSVDNSNPLKWAQAIVFGKNALSESQKYNEASTEEKKAIRTTAEISKKGNLNEEIKQAVERNAKMSKSEEYKKSAQKLEDEMLIKLGKGEVELDENGLYRNKKTGKIQAEFYHNLAKRNREEGKNAKNRYKEFLNSEKGKMVEFEEAKAEYEARLNAGDLSKKEQVKMMDKLRKLAAQKDYRKEYRDGYTMTNSKTEISKLYNLYDENGKADMRNNLNAINDRMLEAGLITQKQYNSRYENINGIEKTKSGGKGRSSSGAKSDTFSVIGSVQPFKVSEAPVVKSAAKTGRGIVKGLKVDSSRAKISTTEMPRMRVTIRR